MARITVKQPLVATLKELCSVLEFREHNNLVPLFGAVTLELIREFKEHVESIDDDMDDLNWNGFRDALEEADSMPPPLLATESRENLIDLRSVMYKIYQQVPSMMTREVQDIIEWLDNKIKGMELCLARKPEMGAKR